MRPPFSAPAKELGALLTADGGESKDDMETECATAHANRTNLLLDALASRRRRVVLASVARESAPVSVGELATRTAASVRETAAGEVDDAARERARAGLVHRDLPTLAEADLVEWDREAGAVAPTDDTVLDDSRIRRVIESPDGDWDDVLGALAHERRRVVLSVLVDHGGAIAPRNLARRTVARERDVEAASTSPDAVERALTSLHHVHLPKLCDAGLLVDDDLKTVRYAGHPDLDEASLAADPGEPCRAVAPVAP